MLISNFGQIHMPRPNDQKFEDLYLRDGWSDYQTSYGF